MFEMEEEKLCLLSSLKTVERLFLKVVYEPNITIKYRSDMYGLVNLFNTIHSWESLLSIRNKFQITYQQDSCFEPSNKRMKYSGNESIDNDVTTFRVSCKCSSKPKKFFKTQELSSLIASVIKMKSGWQVDLKNPNIEIVVHINHSGTIIGIPVFPKPLAERNYIEHKSLRSTTAWIIGSLADIQYPHLIWECVVSVHRHKKTAGDVVIDPMCGFGIILIEAAKQWKHAIYFGTDICLETVQRCIENVKFAKEEERIQIFSSDVTNFPFSQGKADKIVCDLPFGNKFSTVEEVRVLYPKVLASMNRILRRGGTAVLLTSITLKDFLINLAINTVEHHEIKDTVFERKESECTRRTDCNNYNIARNSKVFVQDADVHANIIISGDHVTKSLSHGQEYISIKKSSDSDSKYNSTDKTKLESVQNNGLKSMFVDVQKKHSNCEVKHISNVSSPQVAEESSSVVHATGTSNIVKDQNKLKQENNDWNVKNESIKSRWILKSEHFLQLGEQKCMACVFQKV